MREILFRGKSKVDGSFVFGIPVWSDGVDRIITDVFIGVESGAINAVEVDPLTISEFTGHRLKDGTRVFENDWVYATRKYSEILKPLHRYQVRWHNRSCAFGLYDPEQYNGMTREPGGFIFGKPGLYQLGNITQVLP